MDEEEKLNRQLSKLVSGYNLAAFVCPRLDQINWEKIRAGDRLEFYRVLELDRPFFTYEESTEELARFFLASERRKRKIGFFDEKAALLRMAFLDAKRRIDVFFSP
jgi:hypothetical protein